VRATAVVFVVVWTLLGVVLLRVVAWVILVEQECNTIESSFVF
jgi:hypothetical protein